MAINSEFKTLYSNWSKKAKGYKEDDTYQVFDKFFTFFVIYNLLYNETNLYFHKNKNFESYKSYKLLGDNQAATICAVDLLGSGTILEKIQESDLGRDALKSIKRLFETNSEDNFKISFLKNKKSNKYEYDKGADHKLFNDLKSPEDDVLVTAILTLIYRTRCNMFHGRKETHQVQQYLLNSLSNILDVLVSAMYENLIDLGN